MSLPTRELGQTGLHVSRLGFGGAVIGIDDYLVPDDRDDPAFHTKARQALETAVANGITLFDTAPGYGAGRSERIFGKTLEPHRDKVVLTSKVGVRPGDDPKQWSESLGNSLERLRTSHLDVLQLHGSSWPDDLAAWAIAEPGEWLAEVKARGLTKAVGITAEVPSGGLEDMLRSGRFDTLQMAFSAIYQGACDYQREPFGPIPLAKSLGMGTMTMRTTTSGVLHRLLHSEFPDLDDARISRLAIRFVLSAAEVDALVGMSEPQEVEANCALANDESDRLDLAWLHNRQRG